MKKYLNYILQRPASLAALMLAMAGAVTSQAATAKPPTLTITAPKNNAKLTTESFTVTGTVKAGGNAISNVFVSVNSGVFTNATNSSTTWNLPVSLTPGTNIITAYATDVTGEKSKTNKVEVLYAVNTPLVLMTAGGEGTVSGASNGGELDENVGFTLTQKAGKGFAFAYWSDNAGIVTNSKLSFIMTPGQMITAHFKDITPPTLTITSPTTGEKDSNANLIVTGTAADNFSLATIQVQINGGGWDTATGKTNWSIQLTTTVGDNTVEAYAVDGAGNISKTNSVTFNEFFLSQTSWAPTSVSGKVAILTPVVPAALPPHYLSFNTGNFSYADTNREANDSGIGQYDYQNVDTNFSVVQVAFTAPPTNNGVTANIDLNFTNFNIGLFTNELTSESGTFVIQDTPAFLPIKFSGLKFTALPVGALKTSLIDFTSSTDVKITQTVGTQKEVIPGTYTVFSASPIGGFLNLNFNEGANSGVIYLQVTFTSPEEGIYEVNDYLNGVFEKSDCGTFSE
jgi:hypothetical protein